MKRIVKVIRWYISGNPAPPALSWRFPSEIEIIKSNFKNVYSINIYGRENNLSNNQKNHITETALDNYDKYDYKIKNDSNIKENIINILKEILWIK